jgi:hypothetical protein
MTRYSVLLVILSMKIYLSVESGIALNQSFYSLRDKIMSDESNLVVVEEY